MELTILQGESSNKIMDVTIEPRKMAVSIIEYVFAAIIILNCNTIWTSYEESSFTKILKLFICIVAVLYLLLFFDKKIQLSIFKYILLFAALAVCYFIIYVGVVRYETVNFLYFLIDAVCIYIFVKLAGANGRLARILYKFENLVLIIAVVSLFFWLFGSTLGIIHSSGTVYSSWTGDDNLKSVPSYFNLYFETQQTDSDFVRNTGIFTEAPMFNFILSIALLVELFARRRISKVRCVILILTIVTTISMTGWCLVIIALFAFYFSRKSVTRTAEFVKSLVIPVALIAAVFVLYIFVASKLNTNSGLTRLDDFKAGFEAWSTHIWFGSGFENKEYIQLFMSDFRSHNMGFSNSPTQILANGGVFLAIPYLWFTYKWLQTSIKERNLPQILFFACFIFLFTLAITSYKFVVIFLFMGYQAIGNSYSIQDEAPVLSYQRKTVFAGKFRIKYSPVGIQCSRALHDTDGKECKL